MAPRTLTALCATVLFRGGFGFLDASPERPDIVLLMADQMRWDAMTPELTPNLWRLAQRGANFVNGYSSTPTCTPARAGLLTGLAPWKHGMIGYCDHIANEYPSEMPAYFKKFGYETAIIGKTHFGRKDGSFAAHGFETRNLYEGFDFREDDYTRWFSERYPGQDPFKSGGLDFNSWRGAIFEYPEEAHPSRWVADRTMEFLNERDARRREHGHIKPLFLKVSFHRPHSPYDPLERVFNEVNGSGMAGPARAEDGWDEHLRSPQFCQNPMHVDAFCGDKPEEEVLLMRRAYQASTKHMDEELGRVLDRLDTDRTWFMFVSDHGDMQLDHYLLRKGYPYEGSAHIPFIVAWPPSLAAEYEPGPRQEVVELRDVFPTLLGMAGYLDGGTPAARTAREFVERLDGYDLRCALKSDACEHAREYLDLEHSELYAPWNQWNAIVDAEGWKYIHYSDGTGQQQLFNLRDDPHETRDLIGGLTEENKFMRLRALPKRVRQAYKKLHKAMIQQFQRENRGEMWAKAGKLGKWRSSEALTPHYPHFAGLPWFKYEEQKPSDAKYITNRTSRPWMRVAPNPDEDFMLRRM